MEELMPRWKPDPTFYASPRHAIEAPAEKLAYLAVLDPTRKTPDAMGVVDVDPASRSYGQMVGQTPMPSPGDELHHFGWNACSSHLCPWAADAHVERRYLIVPGISTSRIAIMDTKPDPRRPEIVKVIEGDTVAAKTGYAAPHTVHCGPDGVYLNALGAPDGNGPGGIFRMDHESFDLKGAWEADRGEQFLAYDFSWHMGYDTIVTSEWGTPNMVKDGVNGELLMAGKYGHALHVWDRRQRKHVQRLELGAEQQMVLELRPAHDPTKPYGFAGVVISLEDLSSSIFVWYLDGSNGSSVWKTKKVITIPAEPASEEDLPPMLKAFKAVPPFVTDLNLSLDDRFLYVSCWGTGELRQYDVTNPFEPRLAGSVRLGGIVRRAKHPARPDRAQNGGPQMVEISRDGKRVYLSNGLYTPWDNQFYTDGIRGWLAKLDVGANGGIALDPRFFLELEGGMRPHQVRLEGGDASSDAFCYA
jgi:selenium-binding protein 1